MTQKARPTSRLLINEPPLQVLPSLAEKIGLNQAIFLQQLHYWLGHSGKWNTGDDGVERLWVYNTYQEWQAQFPFWSVNTVIRIISKLEEEGYVLSGNFNKSPIDRTKWYTIDYDQLNRLLSEPDPPSTQSGQMNYPDWVNGLPNVGNSSTQSDQMDYPEGENDLPKMGKAIPETTTETTTEIITEITNNKHDGAGSDLTETQRKAFELLQAYSISEPTVSNLVRTANPDVESVRGWIAVAKSKEDDLKNPQGYVVSKLRSGEKPPEIQAGKGEEPDRYVTGPYAEYIEH